MDKLLRVIIVEHDLNDAERAVSIIKKAGFAVRPERADNVEAFGKLLKQHAPDLVLCNIDMSQISLEQVTNTIQEAGRHIPVIALTADVNANIEDAMALGASDLVSKDRPEHLKQVIDRTATCHWHWREVQRLRGTVKESEKRCKALLSSSKDAIAYVHEGMHIYANEAYVELFGYEDIDELEGMPIMDMVGADDQQKLKDFLRHYETASEEHENLELRLRSEDGNEFPAHVEFSPASMDGEPCTQLVIRRQGDTKELEEQISKLKQQDLVTGLYNRAHFMEELSNVLSKAHNGQGNGALLTLIIDKFPEIRSTIGAAKQEILLADLGGVLKQVCGPNDTLARMEGEHFAILTPVWEAKQLEAYGQKIAKTVADHICEIDDKTVTCTMSIGATILDENAPDENESLVRADTAQKGISEQGGNNILIYRPKKGEMTQKQLDEEWANRIRSAIEGNHLRLLYQPIVSLHGESGERYEVYLRLLDEESKIVPAMEFMPSAERTGVAVLLDRWVLSHAFEALGKRREAQPETIFFIKLSTGALQDPQVARWISEKLRELRIPAASVIFELKEESVVNHLKQAKEFAKFTNVLKCGLALENFGTGIEPFKLLGQFPADFIKIDPSLMENILESEENQESIRGIVDQSHNQNKLVVIPHVDDPNVLSMLWGVGANFVQGNFLSPPSEKLNYDFSSMG
ncbi:MAG: EAL domain-containing protein [Gammaproteobacteria bacterium]|jgi:diguanylate cyclase (GGDEF)-like protein/PAS domain S-box-containing protein